jgi:D-alanine-D-alanine ligase
MIIAILTGGTSTEREVALRSATNMKDWIERSGESVEVYDFPLTIDDFLTKYKEYDLVVPLFHGIYGEDGQITAFLQTIWCPYAYSPFETHALCMDKYRTNLLVETIWVKIPKSCFIARGWAISQIESPLICYPLIVKPNRGWSSIATEKVDTRESLISAQKSITDDDIIIQECIEWREFTVGVYKTTLWYSALPIIEIIPLGKDFFDYEEKYETDGSNEVFTILPDDLRSELEYMSTHIADTLGCRGVVRVDWRYDGKNPYFLEVNTIPGFSAASLVPKMWKKAGKTEKEFIEMLAI